MPLTCDVTRRRLSLGARDTTTGWRSKVWTETTIEGVLLSRASQQVATAIGTYVRNDALFVCADGLSEGDEVKTVANEYYEVKAVREHWIADSFIFRECDLHHLSMHADVDVFVYAATVPVDDARHRTKVYLELYWDGTRTQDDLGNELGIVFMYSDPDYPLTLELEAPEVTDVIVTLGKPDSNPLRGHTYVPYGYEEKVPISIWCLDKPVTTAVKAVWQCEAELRRVTETYPLGSLRNLDKTGDVTKNMGSAILYGSEYTLNYRRDLT